MPISDHLRRLREKIGHERLVLPSVTGVVFDDRRLLMVEHADRGIWVLPGGAIDPGETPADALVREMWEETGLHVRPVAIRGVCSGPEFLVRYRNGDEAIYVMTLFECAVIGGTPRPDGVETLALRWVTQAEALALPTPPWAGTVLPLLFSPSGPGFTPPTWAPPG